jgi:hypothetical protein
MNGRKTLGIIAASFAGALAVCAAACFLPDNPYQRWQLVETFDYGLFAPLRRAYERIHFDSRPIDVAIVGTSGMQLGVSAARVEQKLADLGYPATVENFAAAAPGRNVQWAVVHELLKTKSPKVIVIGVDGMPTAYGNPVFKLAAAKEDIMAPPAPLLHNYFIDLISLPSRQAELFIARFFPNLFGLRTAFDAALYARSPTDFTSGVIPWEDGYYDMERKVDPATLISQRGSGQVLTRAARLLLWCCNDGDDRVYIREIAKEAKARGVRLVFDFVPTYGSSGEIPGYDFLSQYGVVLDNRDLAGSSDLYQNWKHFNHAGAIVNSDRIAAAIAELKTSSLNQQSIK